MTFTSSVRYIFSCLCIYLLLAIGEYFILNPMFTSIIHSYLIRISIYFLFLLIINPIITYIIGEKVPIKPSGLRVEDGLEEALRNQDEFED